MPDDVPVTAETLWAVVPAAGQGTRMARAHVPASRPKQYLELAGHTLLERVLDTLLAVPGLAGVVVALAEDDVHWESLAVAIDPRVHRCTGAASRAGSVAAGLGHLRTLAPGSAWVLVHDAARPLASLADIARLLDAVGNGGADGGLLAVPVLDTLKRADGDHQVLATVPREALWRAQTPQMFRLGELAAALAAALASALDIAPSGAPIDAAEGYSVRADGEHIAITDEASAMELAGHSIQLVEALDPNPKITRAGDLDVAEALLAHRSTGTCA